MPTQEEMDRLVVVLVRARNPNNIGAVARAMHDFGFQELRIVNDYPVPFENARSAVDASSVIKRATSFATLAEALADCTLAIGTTAVGDRALEHPLHTVTEACPTIRAAMSTPGARVALLFGSEKTGLSNEELSYCHWLMTIPMHSTAGTRYASMNLGQAAAVCLFEVVRESHATSIIAVPPSATGEDLKRLASLLNDVFAATGYRQRHPANCDPATIRRLVCRMAPGPNDAAVWMGVLRQVLWKLHEVTLVENPDTLAGSPTQARRTPKRSR